MRTGIVVLVERAGWEPVRAPPLWAHLGRGAFVSLDTASLDQQL